MECRNVSEYVYKVHNLLYRVVWKLYTLQSILSLISDSIFYYSWKLLTEDEIQKKIKIFIYLENNILSS